MSKVLIVSPFVPPHRGGLETYVGWLHRDLAAAGHEVGILATDVRPASATACVHAVDLRVGGGTSWPLVLPSRRTTRLVDRVLDGVDVVVHQNCFWNLTDLVSRRAARRRIFQRTVVHAAFATYPGAGWSTRASATAFRVVAGAPQLRRAAPIAVSRASQRFVADEYGMEAAYVPCPIPQVPVIAGAGFSGEEPLRIAWVGRLAPVKAPVDAIRAVADVARTRSVELHMFGGGPLSDALPDAPFITWHGDTPREDVLRAVADSHVFLSTSLADNAQLALLEALALGRPCVATDVGEAALYLSGQLARGLAPPGDVRALAGAIGHVAADWTSMQAAAAARGEELRRDYAPERAIAMMLQELELAA